MKKILVVVDMQNDFIDGALGTPEARAIVDNVCEKIRGEWDYIYYTLDTHFIDTYLETQEGKKLPVMHCIHNTPGWLLNKDVMLAIASRDDIGYEKIEKRTFGSITLIGALGYLMQCDNITDVDMEVTLVGVCTDICVISNALLLKTYFPEMKIIVDASCCAGSSPEKHRMALEVMKSCQIEVVGEETLCKSLYLEEN